MGKNKYMLTIVCMLLVSSSIVFAEEENVGYWNSFKQSISSIPQSIWGGLVDIWQYVNTARARWNHPRASLKETVFKNKIYCEGKEFEGFRYDTSYDSKETKLVRKQLKLPGIYFADGYDPGICKKDIIAGRFGSQYVENGFSIDDDITIPACMFRLFKGVRDRKITTRYEAIIYMNILSELDSTLSPDFDKDQSGDLFIDYAQKILSHDSENKLSLHGILSAWKILSYRFHANKGLQAAISRTSQNS